MICCPVILFVPCATLPLSCLQQKGPVPMPEKNTAPLHGVKIRTFNTCMIVLSSIVFVFLIANTMLLSRQYHQFIVYTQEYTACESDASMLSAASDYLTEQVRLYTQSMDMQYMEGYFTEINETRRRDRALEDLQRYEPSSEILTSLEAALQSSNDLTVREIYAMKLISVANGYAEETLPGEVRAVQLRLTDAELSPQEMIERARSLVFDSGYQDAKALIRSHLNHFVSGILTTMQARQSASEAALSGSLSRQRLMILLLFFTTIVTFVVITLLIVRPLTIHIKRIKENGTLEITGSYEFKYLALTYNDIYELNAATQAMLTRRAEHDPLTGVMNRGAFESLKLALREHPVSLALMILDVDIFKGINDTYGHETGDDVLKQVARLLTHSFRPSDYVIRLGGDEFAVIIMDIQRENQQVLHEKVSMMNRVLSSPSGGMPSVTVSAGVAFSESGFSDDLFSLADQALYYVKNHGRCGLHIAGEQEKTEG